MKKISIYMLCIICASCSKSSNDFIRPTETLKAKDSTNYSTAKVSLENNWIEYRIKTLYENNYAHWCQLWSSPLSSYEKQNACGPTAYMIAAHMVASAHSYSFMPSSGTKLDAIVNNIGSVPIGMNQIASYLSKYDSPPLISCSHTGSDRNAFKSFLESELYDGNPVIVPIFIATNVSANDSRYCSELQTSNYDIDSSPQAGRTNYILTTKANGGYGHFVVVIAIKIYTLTGNGLVFYKDPLSFSGATKVCSYTRFLTSAKINGSCSEPNCINYDAIAIKKS